MIGPTASFQDLEVKISSKFGTRVKRSKTKKGMEIRICCPFCVKNGKTRDTKYKLWINPSLGVWRCWRCSSKGSITSLLGTPYTAPGGVFGFSGPALRKTTTCDISPGELTRMDRLDPDNVGCRYLRTRGFNPAGVGRCYGVSYCSYGRPFGGDFKFDTTNTVVFPVWMHGKLVGWQARLLYNPESLTDAECKAFGFTYDTEKGKYIRPPKYFTSPGLSKGTVLYNFDNAVKSDIVVVVEGPTDTLAVGPSAVGTLGKGVTDDQIRMLISNWKHVVVLLDPDASAESEMLVNEISKTVPSTLQLNLEGYSDPGSAPTKEIWRQIIVGMANIGVDVTKLNLGPQWCEEIMRKEERGYGSL